MYGFFQDSFGNYSMKRLCGSGLIATACLGTLMVIQQQITDFNTLLVGIATVGAGLLGASMAEKTLSRGKNGN
jgi:hypothetical protein